MLSQNFNDRIAKLESQLRDSISDLDGIKAWAMDRKDESRSSQYGEGRRSLAEDLIELIELTVAVRNIRDSR